VRPVEEQATEGDEYDPGKMEEDARDADTDEDERAVGSLRVDQRANSLERQVAL
jgi:hypothetical protein